VAAVMDEVSVRTSGMTTTFTHFKILLVAGRGLLSVSARVRDKTRTGGGTALQLSRCPLRSVRGLLVVVLCLDVAIAFAAYEAPQAKPAQIVGRVVDASSNQGVAGATVSLSANLGRTMLVNVTSATDGSFVFPAVPPGIYAVFVKKLGYLPGRLGQRTPLDNLRPTEVTIANGQRVGDLTVVIWRAGIVSGAAFDEVGTPLVEATVQAFRETYNAGYSSFVSAATAKTDDRGEYRLSSLLPGRYVVSVRSTEGLAAVFFPGSIRSLEATVLEISTGTEIPGTNIHVGGVKQRGALRGRIRGVDGAQVRLFVDEPGARVSDLPLLETDTNDGTFLFEGVPLGYFLIQLIPKDLKLPITNSVIVIDREAIKDIQIEPIAGGRIVGRVNDVTGSPVTISGTIGVRRADGVRMPPLRESLHRYSLDGTGSFTTGPLTPGKYTIGLADLAPGWRLDSIQVNGVTSAGEVVTVGDQENVPVALRVVKSPWPSISGRVFDSRGGSMAGALIYVFPTNRALWRDFGPAPSRLRMLVTRTDGTFTAEFPRGEYFLAARIQPIQDPWMGAPILEQLAIDTPKVLVTSTAQINLTAK